MGESGKRTSPSGAKEIPSLSPEPPPNSVIPTATDHRKAMICGVEGPGVVTSPGGWPPLRVLKGWRMQPASRFSTRDRRPHRSHLYKEYVKVGQPPSRRQKGGVSPRYARFREVASSPNSRSMFSIISSRTFRKTSNRSALRALLPVQRNKTLGFMAIIRLPNAEILS